MGAISQRTHSTRFAENEVLFTEGNQEQKLYIVESGEVLIYKQLTSTNQRMLASYSDGNCFFWRFFWRDVNL
ncbi:cyclic nucleotide-binding domain-containing protein [bacterium]|nr:cyclic nucleotide-binding domain-containing protein [bacterium]